MWIFDCRKLNFVSFLLPTAQARLKIPAFTSKAKPIPVPR